MNEEYEVESEVIVTQEHIKKSTTNPVSIVVGILIVLVGLWLLVSILKLFPTVMVFPMPVWAVLLGLTGVILAGTNRSALVPGVILMLVSGSYLLRYLGWMGDQSFHVIWLCLIVLVGLLILATSKR